MSKMKIAYLVGENLAEHPGLQQKIDSQIKQWRIRGHKVFVVNHFTMLNSSRRARNPINNWLGSIEKYTVFQRLAFQYKSAYQELKKISPDLVYTRYLFPAPGVTRLLSPHFKTVIEINSDDYSEYMGKGRVTGLYNGLTRRVVLKKAKGLVFVTRELAASDRFLGGPLQITVLPNSVEVNQSLFVPETTNPSPNIVFVGSPNQSWHGLDKVKILVENFRDMQFHIVGPSTEECDRLWGKRFHNATYHGYLGAKHLEKLLPNMDFGIGSLALHRNAMKEACPLKARQYLSFGLPVIGGYTDTDIDDSMPFFLRLENKELNVYEELDRIQKFITAGFGNTDLRVKAIQFAKLRLSHEKREEQRLEFFHSLIQK